MHRIRGKLTYSNVVATLCLVLLVGGGTAYAASQMLPKNSVGAKQLKKHAVTKSKLSKSVQQSFAGPAGARGPQGIQGVQGVKGDPGPSNAYSVFHEGGIPVTVFTGDAKTFLTLKEIPAGSYLMLATLQGDNGTSFTTLSCELVAGADRNGQSAAVGHTAGYSEVANLAIQLTHTFAATGEARLECSVFGNSGTNIRGIQITAIKVGSLRDELG